MRWTAFATIRKKTRNCVRELYRFGRYSVASTIGSNLFRSSDTFIINFLLGPKAVAVYNLPQKLMELVEIPLRSFLVTALPTLASAHNNNNKAEVAFTLKRYAGLLTVVLIPVSIVAILLADVAVALVGGPEYANTEAANIFRIFMSFAFFLPIDRFIGVTLDVIHLPRINFIKILLMLVINVIADFAGIAFFDNIYGVALASIPTFYFGVLFGFHFIKKHLDVNLADVFKFGFAETRWYIKKLRGKA